ncbi:DUF669 domain-containing protein [Ligilactobacillus agilis]|uniref:DUF669 domain-containing protein n=1 Tax=Ligilactobacillus agilis TaxID=1601 RepID=UPI003F8B9431
MAFFTTNYSNVNNNQGNYEPIPDGDYEMLILSASEEVAKTGTQSIVFKMVVRNDLDQALPSTNGKYHNRIVWARTWKMKDTGKYIEDIFQRILWAVGVPEGTKINSLEEFFNIVWNKPIKVPVYIEENEYQGKKTKRNNIRFSGLMHTDFIKVAHTNKDGQVMNQGQPRQQAPDISNNDLPF